MRINPVTGQPQQKAADFPKANQTVIVPGGFNPTRYYNKSEIDALFADLGGDTLWEAATVAADEVLTPADPDYSLLIGSQDGAVELASVFSGATAFFVDSSGQGLNYYIVGGIGSSFVALGGAIISSNARGTAGSETALPSGSLAGVHSFAAFDGSAYTINANGSYGILPGLYGILASDAASDAFDIDVGFTALLGYDLITAKFRNSTQASVVINDDSADVDFQVNYDGGTAMFIEGSTGQMQLSVGSAATPGAAFIGDADTGYHWVASNQWSLDAGGVSRMQISSTEVVVNPGGLASNDFRVLGDTLTHLLFVDVSADKIGINTNAPASMLHVKDGDIEIENSANGVILESPDNTRWRMTLDNSGSLVTTAI